MTFLIQFLIGFAFVFVAYLIINSLGFLVNRLILYTVKFFDLANIFSGLSVLVVLIFIIGFSIGIGSAIFP